MARVSGAQLLGSIDFDLTFLKNKLPFLRIKQRNSPWIRANVKILINVEDDALHINIRSEDGTPIPATLLIDQNSKLDCFDWHTQVCWWYIEYLAAG